MNPIIECRGLSKKYANDFYALANLNLVLERGQIIGLLGPNGSGKTTLLSALFPCPMPGLTSWAVPKQGAYLKDNFSSKTVQIGRFNPDNTGTENRMLPVLDAFSQTGVSFLRACADVSSDWITIDEIGYLESTCPEYQNALSELMACKHLLMVVRKQKLPFLDSLLAQQDVFDYCVAKVSEKKELQTADVKGSQFRKPLLEFSGSCAGCAETSYARLVTQLFGDKMYISNATGCSSIWGNPGATNPYCTNAEGKGPAWCNSLFEDNAEHGFGMYLGQKAIRDSLIEKTKALIAVEWTNADLKAAAQKYLDTVNDLEANAAATKAYVAALEENVATVDELAQVPQFAEHAAELKAKGEKYCDCDACALGADILSKKDYLSKKSVWIFGGDGWAYDIGFGGVDHVLASGEDVNIFVFDTEVYSNTGGQASKASNIGQVAQFAAAGKETKSKSLAEIAMSYGYVYVAQVAMGANAAQTLKAIQEAEAYHGPSLIIGYAPCEMHSIKGGMQNCQKEMKKAVECGYWNMFRFNPAAEKKFTLDSKAPAGGYQEFLMNEARYSRLTREFPERATVLFAKNEENAKERYEHLLKLVEMYDK